MCDGDRLIVKDLWRRVCGFETCDCHVGAARDLHGPLSPWASIAFAYLEESVGLKRYEIITSAHSNGVLIAILKSIIQ